MVASAIRVFDLRCGNNSIKFKIVLIQVVSTASFILCWAQFKGISHIDKLVVLDGEILRLQSGIIHRNGAVGIFKGIVRDSHAGPTIYCRNGNDAGTAFLISSIRLVDQIDFIARNDRTIANTRDSCPGIRFNSVIGKDQSIIAVIFRLAFTHYHISRIFHPIGHGEIAVINGQGVSTVVNIPLSIITDLQLQIFQRVDSIPTLAENARALRGPDHRFCAIALGHTLKGKSLFYVDGRGQGHILKDLYHRAALCILDSLGQGLIPCFLNLCLIIIHRHWCTVNRSTDRNFTSVS